MCIGIHCIKKSDRKEVFSHGNSRLKRKVDGQGDFIISMDTDWFNVGGCLTKKMEMHRDMRELLLEGNFKLDKEGINKI